MPSRRQYNFTRNMHINFHLKTRFVHVSRTRCRRSEAVRSSPLPLASPFGRRGDAKSGSESLSVWGFPNWSNCRRETVVNSVAIHPTLRLVRRAARWLFQLKDRNTYLYLANFSHNKNSKLRTNLEVITKRT